jgi:hypothetical protein
MILMHRCKKNILIKKYILKIHLITKHTIITGSRLIELNWVFGSVVVVAFQIAFRAEIYANDVFLFFKNHF